jgi:hypothetical protein
LELNGNLSIDEKLVRYGEVVWCSSDSCIPKRLVGNLPIVIQRIKEHLSHKFMFHIIPMFQPAFDSCTPFSCLYNPQVLCWHFWKSARHAESFPISWLLTSSEAKWWLNVNVTL